MAKFTTTHEINCDANSFWKLFFDSSFNDKLYLETLGYYEFKIAEHSETDQQIRQKAVAQPKIYMPGPMAKLFGDNYRYTEEGTFDKATQVYRWKQIPSVQADKLRFEGTIRVESIGDRKIRRIMETTVEAKLFGIGGLVESTMEKQLREQADRTAAFFNKYVASAA
ncbi:MAG TPA: DUF2505 family protein [Blastocatellia bacterium]|nr:DUF2505 family protein [Blastocatellia bacterium]HMX28520.1 DUF2505 family protein [Blastocatellia bacterium]HMZ21370.1 DUF2505 family protein [Blastocatellia bacterium]HNG30844.1 DUF2505 family protein [Blastocatellia bacterium]